MRTILVRLSFKVSRIEEADTMSQDLSAEPWKPSGDNEPRAHSPPLPAHSSTTNFISLSKLKDYVPKSLTSFEPRRRSQDNIVNLELNQITSEKQISEHQNCSSINHLHLNDQRTFRCTRANQILAAELNKTAMVAAESHLDQLNHYYMTNNNTNLGMNHTHHHPHQINHHHYGYNAQSTGANNIHIHQNHHHLAAGGAVVVPNHEQSPVVYSHVASQHQHHHHHHSHPQHHNQHQQPTSQHHSGAAGLTGHHSIYQQIATANTVAGIGIANNCNSNPNYVSNVNNNVHYHGQMQSANNQANNLLSEAHQSHLHSAAAAAVVSQTLKTVASQHNQQQNHYGGSVSDGFPTNAPGLMNVTAHPQQQFHNVNTIGQHHHQLIGQNQGTGSTGIEHHSSHQHNQQQNHQQSHQQHQAQTIHMHQSNSIVTRKYQCKMCPQVFMSKAEIKYHNQNHLREAKPYKCLQCPKAFANSSYLSQHMRIHQGLKPYTCDICARKFTQLSHLQQHKRTHTGDKPYKCNYMNCTKQFSQLSNLQSHSRCHQLDKPYKCNSCYKCFHDEQSLLEHIPRHLESKHLKRNLCIFCGSSYQQERGLVKHFQQYHTDKSPTLVAAAIAAGSTGNTSLIASLVSTTTSSSHNKFLTQSGSEVSVSSTNMSRVGLSGSGNINGIGCSNSVSAGGSTCSSGGPDVINQAAGNGTTHIDSLATGSRLNNNPHLGSSSSDVEVTQGSASLSGGYQIRTSFI